MKIHLISSAPLSFQELLVIRDHAVRLDLSAETSTKIRQCQQYLVEKLANSTDPVYGINTGFGSLYNKHIPSDQLGQLQVNLVMSHACGTGREIPQEVVRLMLFLKIQSLAYGYSGVKLETVQRLIDFYNADILPVIFEAGSLGASGDLAPLAHLTLPLLGMGEVWHQGVKKTGNQVLTEQGWQPLELGPKEGLALLNGTQFMTAWGVWACLKSKQLLTASNGISALALDSFDGRREPFLPQVHQIRAHKGQQQVAHEMLEWLEGSELIKQPKKHVQDPYSFRCIPQVHGATADALEYASAVLLLEANSVTDNPNIFPDLDTIISAGNFHGQPLALAMDFLGLAMAEIGSISERRTYQLISGGRELPNYLVANPGIHSGLMIPQYTAASLVSRNKQLCTPASADSIVSSNGQEDHVSMGANAAVKLGEILTNLTSILAIEWITATQALHFRRPLKTSPRLEKLADTLRQVVPFIKEDRVLHWDIKAAENLLNQPLP